MNLAMWGAAQLAVRRCSSAFDHPRFTSRGVPLQHLRSLALRSTSRRRPVAAPATQEAAAPAPPADASAPAITFDNNSDLVCTVVAVDAQERDELMLCASAALSGLGLKIQEATIGRRGGVAGGGRVLDTYKVLLAAGTKVPDGDFDLIRGYVTKAFDLARSAAASAARDGLPLSVAKQVGSSLLLMPPPKAWLDRHAASSPGGDAPLASSLASLVPGGQGAPIPRVSNVSTQAGGAQAGGAPSSGAGQGGATTLTMRKARREIQELERAAADMAAAATELMAVEVAASAIGDEEMTDAALAEPAMAERIKYQVKAEQEAVALLERRMAAMEAAMIARRKKMLELLEPPKPVMPKGLEELMKPPEQAVRPVGPAVGNGFEIILQGFNWESCNSGKYYATLKQQAKGFAEAGFSAVWMPPPSDSVSPQGYLPRDLYVLNSRYGSEEELRDCLRELKGVGIKPIADIVINHRCAHYQGEDGKWNKFGGRLDWGPWAICAGNPAFGGKGGSKTGDDYSAAPNLDHKNPTVRQNLKEWLKHLLQVGYEGYRFDFVKGYSGGFIKEYIDAAVPQLAFGEYWDACAYANGVLEYNQDAHRQRTVNWCDATGGTSGAFDFTTKGVLQEAVYRKEYWRLIDSQGRPPGLMGIWNSRAVTFIENHDTGSTLGHWPFPAGKAAEGYAYILTHPGTPCVFYDHLFDANCKAAVLDLVKLRRKLKINAKSTVKVIEAKGDLYAACVEGVVCMKIGPGDWSPNKTSVGGHKWQVASSGPGFAVWEKASPGSTGGG